MFTGIIELLGKVEFLKGTAQQKELSLTPLQKISCVLGESIAVNGVCLTVKKFSPQNIFFDLGLETLKKTTLGNLKKNNLVHLERALAIGDRLSGHFVLGHIDSTATIIKKIKKANGLQLEISFPQELKNYFVPQGSVAIDGVSLTISKLYKNSFEVFLIPYTLEKTNFINLKVRDKVNLEVDYLGKYVVQILKNFKGIK